MILCVSYFFLTCLMIFRAYFMPISVLSFHYIYTLQTLRKKTIKLFLLSGVMLEWHQVRTTWIRAPKVTSLLGKKYC